MAWAIRRHIESPLSARLIEGEFGEGDTVLVDKGEDELTFAAKEKVSS